MPREPPVTSAIFPSSLPMSFSFGDHLQLLLASCFFASVTAPGLF
jgi:hypothetical protein